MRLTETPDQHSLPREQRLRNLQGVFATHPLHAGNRRPASAGGAA